MKPLEQKLLSMLSGNDVTFYIPPYQRNYEWDNDQCNVFFEDVLKTTKENLSGQISEHFFGTVTYVQSESIFGQPNKLILIDGQQRITTTMLFLVALRDIIEDENMKNFIDQTYLKNNKVVGEGEYKIKLKQVETDWNAYCKIILSMDLSDEDKMSAVYRNYKFFRDELRKISVQKDYSLDKLVQLGLAKFSVVTIQLEPEHKWENPQEIFESMNSLGKPLSLADLVRNYLLLGLSAEKQDFLYHNYWVALEKKLPGQLSNFIRDFMQCEDAQPYSRAVEANYKPLYANFKNLFKFSDSETLLKKMAEYAPLYAGIVLGTSLGNDKISRYLSDLRSIGAVTIYSFVMGILKSWKDNALSDADVIDLLNVLRTYLLRRRFAELGSAENKAFPLWNNHIKAIENSTDKKLRLYEIMASQDPSMRMPGDAEIKKIMASKDFYAFRQLKFIFALIEEKMTKSMPDLSDKNLQIEHIMPQTLNEEWISMLGVEDYVQVHENYLHTLGNLTLIRHNQELGNESFSKKKDVYINNSALQISQREITNKDVWNKESIEQRTNWLIDFLLKELLPIPNELFNSANAPARKSKTHTHSFVELGLVGEVINYIDDKSIVARVVNEKEVEFEGKNWRLSPLTKELKTRQGICSPSGSYQGSIFWEYKGQRIFDMYSK